MDWRRIRDGFNSELGKIAAFHVGNLSPDTIMENSLPPGPMETSGLHKARQILARVDENIAQKTASKDPEKDPYVTKVRPWAKRALVGAGSGAMLSRLVASTPHATRVGAGVGAGVALADKAYTLKKYRNVSERKKEKTKIATLTDPLASLKASQKIGRFSRVATTNTIGKVGPGIKQQIPLLGRTGTLPGQK